MRSAELYSRIAELARQRPPFVVATIIDAEGSRPRGVGTKMLILSDGTTVETIGGGALERQVVADAAAILALGASHAEQYQLRTAGEHAVGALCGGEVTVFFEVHRPDRTLFVVGAGHVGQSLCSCAKLVDFQVTVLDSRAEMVTRDRFPEADQLICGDPAEAVDLHTIDESTRIVIVTHSHVLDEEALHSVIDSPAAYIGMIGSANKVRTIVAKLREKGVAPELIDRVHAPIGLDIGAETPAELALCIIAEIVADGYGKLSSLQTLQPVAAGDTSP